MMKKNHLFLIILLFTGSVLAQESATWYDGNHIQLSLDDIQSRNSSHWVFTLYQNGDVLIKKEESNKDNTVAGVVGIVGGRFMISKDLDLKEGYEIDAVDWPVLMFQLLLQILSNAVPDGPASIQGRFPLNFEEENTDIQIGTTSATGGFSAPWSIDGYLEQTGAINLLYNFSFKSKVEKKDYVLTMHGYWKQDPQLTDLTDSMKLVDWKVYKLGVYSKEYGGGTIFDYGAQPINEIYKTLGDLREAL